MQFNRSFKFSDRLKEAYNLNRFSAIVQELSLRTDAGLVEAHKFFEKVFNTDNVKEIFAKEYQEKDFKNYTNSDFIKKLLVSDLVVITPNSEKSLYDLNESLMSSIEHFKNTDDLKSLNLAQELLARIQK
jgi:hypothetical protein